MGAPKFGRQSDIDILEAALESIARGEDHAFNEADLLRAIEARVDIDIAQIRREEAKRIFQASKRPNKTPPEGSLWLPGLEPFSYEPLQILPDGGGQTVERRYATYRFLDVEVTRSEKNVAKIQRAHRRKVTQFQEYQSWRNEQVERDRHPSEITFDNFVKERGFWRPDPIEGEDDGD